MNIIAYLKCWRVGIAVAILLISVWGIPINASAQGSVYYVAPPASGGNNLNPGTEAQPWATIQKAANTLTAGDTVYIKTGTYQEHVIPQNSGSTGNTITYAAYPGHTVTIDGTGVSLPGWAGLFEVSNKSYIRISGLRIVNVGPSDNNAGILVDTSSHIIIENNYTYNTVSSGIGVWDSDNIIIDGNEVELACNDGEQEDITIANTDTFEVRNNEVHHSGPGTNGGEGIDTKDGSRNGKVYKNHVHHINRTGIYADSWDKHTYNIEVYQNIVHNSSSGITLAAEKGGLLENINVYNNIVFNNQVNGLEIGNWGEPGYAHPIQNVKFINNTAYNNGITWGGGIHLENPTTQNVVIRNNIFSQNLSFQISNEAGLSGANLTVDHNLIDGFRGDTGEIYGSDYVTGNPQFVKAAGADFHLQNTSPAIDQASGTDAPIDDYEENTRPQDGDGNGSSLHDMGAYEVTPNLTLFCNTDPHPVQATTPAITYTITLKNNGAAAATGVAITGTIPNSTTYASGGAFDGTNVVWSGLTVAGNTSINVSFQVSVTSPITDGDQLINTISASSAGGLTASLPANTMIVGLRSIYLPVVFRNS